LRRKVAGSIDEYIVHYIVKNTHGRKHTFSDDNYYTLRHQLRHIIVSHIQCWDMIIPKTLQEFCTP